MINPGFITALEAGEEFSGDLLIKTSTSGLVERES